MIEKFSNGVCDAVATHHPSLDLKIITAYRPPDTTLEEFQELINFIERCISNSKYPSTHIVVTGDFNFPKEVVAWLETKDGIVPIPTNCVTSTKKLQLQRLLELSDEHYLHQVINVPTRNGPPSNVLDILLTNTPDTFHSLESIDMVGTSDLRTFGRHRAYATIFFFLKYVQGVKKRRQKMEKKMGVPDLVRPSRTHENLPFHEDVRFFSTAHLSC